MVNIVEIDKIYWYVEKWCNMPNKCRIIRYNPISQNNNIEYWDGKCLDSFGVRGFRKEDLYDTEKEAKEVCNQRYEDGLAALKNEISSPESLLTDLVNTKVLNMAEHSFLDIEIVMKELKEKVKEYFNIDVKIER